MSEAPPPSEQPAAPPATPAVPPNTETTDTPMADTEQIKQETSAPSAHDAASLQAPHLSEPSVSLTTTPETLHTNGPVEATRAYSSSMPAQSLQAQAQAQSTNLPTLAPARSTTPSRSGASPHPLSSSTTNTTAAATNGTQILPPSAPIAPSSTGSAVRVYLNSKVVPALLEGMKGLGEQQPERPLEWLSEFLGKKSREVERRAEV